MSVLATGCKDDHEAKYLSREIPSISLLIKPRADGLEVFFLLVQSN